MGWPASSPVQTVTSRARVVLLGQGIGYSASPPMQNAAFQAAGLNWDYSLLDLPAEGLGEAVRRLRGPEYRGANVTIPHKIRIMDFLDQLEGDALASGAVNTICKIDGALIGHNTDVAALRAALGTLGWAGGSRAVILGGGGGARAAAVALAGTELTFVVRRPPASPLAGATYLNWDDASWGRLAQESSLLINATPVGRDETDSGPLLAALPRSGSVIDLVYVRGGTPLVRAARERGRAVCDGWEILLAQGAAAFGLWTGLAAPLDAMWAALGK